MALSERVFYCAFNKTIVRLNDEPGYLCYNTGNRVYIAQIVGTETTFEVYMSDLREVGPLEALAMGLDV